MTDLIAEILVDSACRKHSGQRIRFEITAHGNAFGGWPSLSPHTTAGALPFSRPVREGGALAGHRGGGPPD